MGLLITTSSWREEKVDFDAEKGCWRRCVLGLSRVMRRFEVSRSAKLE